MGYLWLDDTPDSTEDKGTGVLLDWLWNIQGDPQAFALRSWVLRGAPRGEADGCDRRRSGCVGKIDSFEH